MFMNRRLCKCFRTESTQLYIVLILFLTALLCMIASLRTFTNDKLEYWRESSSGINKVAYFLAKDTVDHFNTVIKPVVFLSMFYFFNNSRSTFVENYVVTLALVYCVTGIAYIFAITMDSGPAQLVRRSFLVLTFFPYTYICLYEEVN